MNSLNKLELVYFLEEDHNARMHTRGLACACIPVPSKPERIERVILFAIDLGREALARRIAPWICDEDDGV